MELEFKMGTKYYTYQGVNIISWSYAGKKVYRPVLNYSKDFKTLAGAKRFIKRRKKI